MCLSTDLLSTNIHLAGVTGRVLGGNDEQIKIDLVSVLSNLQEVIFRAPDLLIARTESGTFSWN